MPPNSTDHLQLVHGNDVSEAVRNMVPVNIKIPPIPQGKKDPTDTSGGTILPVSDVGLYGKGNMQKPRIEKINVMRIWPRPISLFIIAVR